MLRVLTTNNVEVFRHLGAGPFQRLDVQHTVAATFDDARAQVRARRPQIAILDAEIAGGSGFELCRQIKADPALSAVHVMIVLSAVISRDAIAELQACGCDDVLAVPIHSDDFYHHIAQIAGLPLRRERRIGASLEVHIPATGQSLTGTVENVSGGGAGVLVDGALEIGQEVTARILQDDKPYPDILAVVAWAHPTDTPGQTSAGFTFSEVPMKTRLLLERLCLFDIAPQDGATGVTVSLFGDFTEIVDFSALSGRLQSEDNIDFYMRAIRYISSAGVRSWCNFLDTLVGKRYSFRHCSIAFTSQAAMVPMAVGDGAVVSLEAPYRCETCDRDDLRLLEPDALGRDGEHIVAPALKCAACGDELVFDDVPDRYFAFLRGP